MGWSKPYQHRRGKSEEEYYRNFWKNNSEFFNMSKAEFKNKTEFIDAMERNNPNAYGIAELSDKIWDYTPSLRAAAIALQEESIVEDIAEDYESEAVKAATEGTEIPTFNPSNRVSKRAQYVAVRRELKEEAPLIIEALQGEISSLGSSKRDLIRKRELRRQIKIIGG